MIGSYVNGSLSWTQVKTISKIFFGIVWLTAVFATAWCYSDEIISFVKSCVGVF